MAQNPKKKAVAKPTKSSGIKWGGARPGSGRKSAEEQGLEKKKMYPGYLYPSHAAKLVGKYGSITAALESLL